MRVVTAARKADIGFTRFAWAVHHAANHRKRHRRRDMGQALFQHAHGVNHIELLARAGRARDHVHAAMAQIKRLQYIETDLDFLDRIGR